MQLDGSGNPIPTYTEAQVQAFARAYTGWTYATPAAETPTKFPNNTANYDDPMAAVESQHDMNAKTLLNGTTLPAGQSSSQDLTGALTNIFNHPNVGPFVCRQLIQHLVTSNPSPAYVARIAAVFANNGTGMRGNMQAVVQAILQDPEARAGDANPSLRWRPSARTDAVDDQLYAGARVYLYWGRRRNRGRILLHARQLHQRVRRKALHVRRVFNFFPPSYVIPGTTTNAPEFGIENTASAILRLTLADNLVNNRITDFTVDLSATSALGMIASATGNANGQHQPGECAGEHLHAWTDAGADAVPTL